MIALGSAQTLAWGSSYYLLAMLATPMARDLGMSTPTAFAAFSAALVISALVGPLAGRAIDSRGGRIVLMAANGLFAAGLSALGVATSPWQFFAGWAVIGVAMGSGLYEAAFSTLVRLYREESRNAITGVTLIAGFASTVSWPLTAMLETRFDWRIACFVWAALHLVVALPLNALVPSPVAALPAAAHVPSRPALSSSRPGHVNERTIAVLLAYVFAVTWFISTAMASHLPRLLEIAGATLLVAVGAGALVGPAQVGGRLLEFGVLRHFSPLFSARCASLAHPLGAVVLVIWGAPSVAAFAILHGAGNGILTIALGTLPLIMFGPDGYGARQGWLMMPARFMQALAPFVFGIALDRYGVSAALFSAMLGVSGFAALMMLSSQPYRRPTGADV